MSFSKQGRKQLRHYCAYHLRTEYRSFAHDEGKLFDGGKTFICFRCLRRRRQHKRPNQRGRKRESTLEDKIAMAFDRKKYVYKRNFKLGKYRFDFAFSRFKLLLEIDGKTFHRKEPNSLKASVAQKYGWTLCRIENGEHLISRVMEAICQHANCS